jgi:hypothetical protein
MKDLFSENYKSLIKEIKEDTQKKMEIFLMLLGWKNTAKMSILPKGT